MRLQEERITPPYTGSDHNARQVHIQTPGSGPITPNTPGSGPIIPNTPSIQASPPRAPGFRDDSAPTSAYVDEELSTGLQEAHITAILRSMALGHLLLGVALAVGGAIAEVVLQQAAFFGLAASGGMLGACGLITMLGISRQRATASPLAFYLLPYADFAIVGLWLLLFSASGPIVLFYAYVVVSAALLLGSRHAIALTSIAVATILAISLGQAQTQIMPIITLTFGAQVTFTIISTTLALGLIAYVARLFSLNLDRFIALSNRQRTELHYTRQQMAEHQAQTQAEIENMSNTYVRFISGDSAARVPLPAPQSSLAFAATLLNTLLDQLERHTHAATAHARLEERIGELSQALDRLTTGDITALHIISGPTGTTLDTLTLALGRTGRQLISTQQALKSALGGYTAVLGIASDLSALHQTLDTTDSPLLDIQKYADLSAAQLHTMLASGGDYTDLRTSERPFLHEMELHASQQKIGAEVLRARLKHIGGQMQSIEAELRRVSESMEQLTRGSRPIRVEQTGTPANPPAAGTQPRQGTGPATAVEAGPSVTPASTRPASGAMRSPDGLPRRFNGPLMPPGRLPGEKSHPRQGLVGRAESEATGHQR